LKPNSADCSNGVRAADAAWEVPAAGTAARIVLVGLTVYKRAFSPYFAGSCRFLPSCADYAREAVLRYGAVQGSWLALKRLARCHPLCAAGFDPVPHAPVRRPASALDLRPLRSIARRSGH
jgi:putative membrane protein insertion efficiency factor